MEARVRMRAGPLAGVVVASVLCDWAAGPGRAAAVSPPRIDDPSEKCPAFVTVRSDERTRLGFSPNVALRSLRVVPRRLHFDREMPMLANSHLFAELGISAWTPDDEAVLTFVASGAPSTYCPALPDFPLSIPGTVTVRLSRGQVLKETTALTVYTSAGHLAGSVTSAGLIGHVAVNIIGEFEADHSSLSVWTGNGSDAHWFEARRANDTAGAPPSLRDALASLGGRPMSCGGRSPAIQVAAVGFGEAQLRVAWPNARPLTFRLPIRPAGDGAAVRGWRLTGPSSEAAAPPRSIARQADCASEERRPWWAAFDVTPDLGGQLQARGTFSWPGGCAANVTCAF